jgi:hypothetical protein
MKPSRPTTSWGAVFTLVTLGVLIGVVLHAGVQEVLGSLDRLLSLAWENEMQVFIALGILVFIVAVFQSRQVRSR